MTWQAPGKLHPFQLAFRNQARSHRYTNFFGGLQAGKSVAGAATTYDRLYGPNPVTLPPHIRGRMHMEVWVLSKSYALADSALATLRAWTPPDIWLTESTCRRRGLKRYDSRTFWLERRTAEVGDPLEICLRVRTARDPESLRATPSLGLAWTDETAHWPELAWHNLQGRGIVAKTKILATTTPKGRNYIYRDGYLPATEPRPADGGSSEWRESKDGKLAVVQCRSIDNPLADAEYVQSLVRKFGSQYAAQELEAMFVEAAGLVYYMFRRFDEINAQGQRIPGHMRKRPSDDPSFYERVVCGYDPGQADPAAVVVLGREKASPKRWWVLEDFKRPGMTIEQMHKELGAIDERWKPAKWYYDKRRTTDGHIIRQWFGSRVQANRELYGEVERKMILPMVRYVGGLFENDRLAINDECEWTAEELEAYHYEDKEDRNRGENPADWQNHCMDALRYAICSEEHYMPLDTRPRYRRGASQEPQLPPEPLREMPKASTWVHALDKAMDEREAARLRRRG